MEAERFPRSRMTTGVPVWVIEESESPATELSRLNNPITEFFCLGFAIPPMLTNISHRNRKKHQECMISRVNEKCSGNWTKKNERKINLRQINLILQASEYSLCTWNWKCAMKVRLYEQKWIFCCICMQNIYLMVFFQNITSGKTRCLT